MTRRMRGAAFLALGAMAAVVLGCGGGDFPRKSRSTLPFQLTGVIVQNKLTISPDKAASGPLEITITNQTGEAHTVTLEGSAVRDTIGPINPQDTGTIQKSLPPGTYTVRAGSSVAVPSEIRAGRLKVTRARRDSNGDLLTP
jgi:DNA-binding beta-propeller fold protein YncE